MHDAGGKQHRIWQNDRFFPSSYVLSLCSFMTLILYPVYERLSNFVQKKRTLFPRKAGHLSDLETK